MTVKKGQKINPTGIQGKMPEAYRAKERFLQAFMSSATHDEVIALAKKVSAENDEGAEKYLKIYVSALAGLKVSSDSDKERHSVEIENLKLTGEKLKAEISAINKNVTGASAVIDEKAQIARDSAILGMNELEESVAKQKKKKK